MSYHQFRDIANHLRNAMRISTTFDHTVSDSTEIHNVKAALTEAILAIDSLSRIVYDAVRDAQSTSAWLDMIERDAFTGADANKEEPQ